MPYDRYGRFYPAAGAGGARQSMPVPPQPDYGEWLRRQGQRGRDTWQRYYDAVAPVRDVVFAPIGTYSIPNLTPEPWRSRATQAGERLLQLGRVALDPWEQMPRWQPPPAMRYMANQWGQALGGEEAPASTYLPMMPQGMGPQGMATQGLATQGSAPVTITIRPARREPNPWSGYGGNPWRVPEPWGEWGW